MPDKARRGRIRIAAEVTHELRSLLLRRYRQHPPFVNEFQALEGRYRRLLRALATTRRHWNLTPALTAETLWAAAQEIAHEDWFPVPGIPDYLRPGPGYSKPRQRNPHHFLKRYLDEVADLAQRWGLNAPWCPHYLHQALVYAADYGEPHTYRVDAFFTPLTLRPLILPHPNPVFESRDDYSRAAASAAERLWDEAARELEQAEGFVRVDTRPELGKHMRWLFQRIACKKPPRIIAAEEGYSQAAVEKAIAGLARALLRGEPLRKTRRRRNA